MKMLATARIRGAKVLISKEKTKIFWDLTEIKPYFLWKIKAVDVHFRLTDALRAQKIS